MAKGISQLPSFSGATANKDSSSKDNDQPAPRRRFNHMKSDVDRTGATTMINKVMYTSAGKPASYQDISAPLFVY